MKFQFIADDLCFEVPWTQPDLFRLKLWHKQTWNPWPCRVKLQPFLYGDFWSSGADSASALSIWLETCEPWSTITSADWIELRTHLRRAFHVALDRYRLLLTLSVGESQTAQQLGELLLQAELEQSIGHLRPERVPARLDLIANMQTYRDGAPAGALAIDLDSSPTSQDFGGWHRHSHRYLETMGTWAAKGRVYYRPVLLNELLDW